MLMIICTWKSQRMGTWNLKLMLISWTWGCTTFHNFLECKKKKKLAGLWLAGEVVNHVGIYGSKAAEGLSAFQRRSCSWSANKFSNKNNLHFTQMPSIFLAVNSSPPSAANMHQRIWSALIQIMACHLFSTKPLSKPILSYCQMDPWQQSSLKFQPKYKTFHSRKYI